jgi:TIR domain-containing protein
MSADPGSGADRAPIAFISHSSKDKGRFVRRLEAGLRARGVQTIFDERDFHLGDSLPDAIFEKGIAVADVIVIVLSRASLESRYVTEERDAAVMRRIEEDVPNLVLVLDGLTLTEIPMALRARIRFHVDPKNDQSVEEAIRRTADAAHKHVIGQEVGDAPAWAQAPRVMITDDPLDGELLGVAVRARLDDDTNLYVEREAFFTEAERMERSREDAEESLKILDKRGLLVSEDWLGAGNVARLYGATRYGMDSWLRAADPKYEENLRLVAASIINDGCRFNYEIENKTGFDRAFVNHALDELEARGHVEVRHVSMGGIRPVKPTASLRRWLNQ